MTFQHPAFLLLLIPFAAMAVWFFISGRSRRAGAAAVSSSAIVKKRKTLKAVTYPYLNILRFACIFFLILSLAGPGRSVSYSTVKNSGIDIMIALDVSGSMEGLDFEPENRLGAAKKALMEFVSGRENDRIGLVLFAGEARLQCPLTLEHGIIQDIMDETDFDSVDADGTAVGEAMVLCASAMTDLKGKSRIILMITDGVNNSGSVDPETAASACQELGIKVYTLGIGKEGMVPYPGGLSGKRYVPNSFDPVLLKDVSDKTGGRFYRALSSDVFFKDMKEIDSLEKSTADIKRYNEFQDRSGTAVAAAVILFLAEILLRSLVYRKMP